MDLVVLALILAVFPKTNIYAVVFAGILFSLSMCVLNNLSIRKHLNFRNEFKNTYVKPLIAAAIMGVVTWVVYYGLFAITKRPSISMLIAILIAIVVYLIAFVVVTGTTEAEMRRMPMGTKLVKVLLNQANSKADCEYPLCLKLCKFTRLFLHAIPASDSYLQ